MVVVASLLIAVLAVLLVLEPIIRAASGQVMRAPEPLFDDSDAEVDPLARRRDQALAALREIEFDQATGKLSDDDYQRLYARYSVEAVAALRAEDAAGGPPAGGAGAGVDAVEQLIAEARSSARRAGARFCEECGAALEGSGRFCVACGVAVPA